MVTYEWCRVPGGKFLGYVDDVENHIKMFAFGPSHSRLCRNFAVLLFRHKKAGKMNTLRYRMANEENKELFEKFGHYKRGNIINDNNTSVKTVKEKYEEDRIIREEENKVKEQLMEQNKLEESFDKFMTKTDENGNIYIYGIKLIKIYKNKGDKNEETFDGNI